MSRNRIRILIADDHKIVRIGLSAVCATARDIAVVGEADDGEAAIRAAFDLKPDVVVMDLMMPGTDGVEATERIHAALPGAKVLILTSYTTSDNIAHALRAGATGALLKTADDETFLDAIRTLAAGGRFVQPEIENLLAEDPPVEPLTPRQAEVLKSLSLGLRNKEIAERLGISKDRVDEHISALFSKTGASNRAEAVAIALRKQLLKI